MDYNIWSDESLKTEYKDIVFSLNRRDLNFSEAYIILNRVNALVDRAPCLSFKVLIDALKDTLTNKKYLKQKQAYFLYKNAAISLILIILNNKDKEIMQDALQALLFVMYTTKGTQYKAASEALGSLPLKFNNPVIKESDMDNISFITWDSFFKKYGQCLMSECFKKGRSIVMPVNSSEDIMVVKIASDLESAKLLGIEAAWMNFFLKREISFKINFQIPNPIKVKNNYLFQITVPDIFKGTDHGGEDKKYYGICFTVNKNYFYYINGHNGDNGLNLFDFSKSLSENSWLLGKLASLGIVHTSPIPLFHNRVSKNRRRDGGLYEWPRGGRLDKWLESSKYPNFGLTGVRDFEHFAGIDDLKKKIYFYVGTHILSLVLVAGSYFRFKEDADIVCTYISRTCDVRHLFEKKVIKKIILEIFLNYYNGFTGKIFKGIIPLDLDLFADRLISEMGCDKYMEEVFRVVDQDQMSQGEFFSFLSQRGMNQVNIDKTIKGKEEIVLISGPHLGGFNQKISIPELTDFISAVSALCISGKYLNSKTV